MAIDRYKQFRINNTVKNVPFIKLKRKNSDKEIIYRNGVDRLDILSARYYEGDPNYGWLILLANPQYSGLEFEIPDGSTIVIPFPLETTLTQYNNEISKYSTYYGF